MEPVTLVDAENVRRSQWPNIGREELVALVRRWAEATGSHALVVFDGDPPDVEGTRTVKVVGTTKESADDRIARDAEKLARRDGPTGSSPRTAGCARGAGGRAEDLVGGGTFIANTESLVATSGPSAPSSRAEPGRPA